MRSGSVYDGEAMTGLRRETVEHVVRAAALAPLLPGAVPPTLRWTEDVLELRSHRSSLEAEDRDGFLVAGAALQHVQVAARGLGLQATCEPFPVPNDPGRVARVRLTAGRPATPRELELAAAVVDRYAPTVGAGVVPLAPAVLAVLRLAVEAEGARLVVPASDSRDGQVVALLVTPDDGPAGWVVAGCALGALLLKAHQYGVQVAVDVLPPASGTPWEHRQLELVLSQLRLRLTPARRATGSGAVSEPLAVAR